MDLLANYGSDGEDDDSTEVSVAVSSPSGSKSLFSLPPPRASAQASFVVEAVKRSGSQFRSSVGPKAEPTSLPSDFFGGTSIVSGEETSPEAKEKPSSLFTKLPPPSSTRFSLASLPPPSMLKKKTVEFKPPINLSALESADVDDLERRTKRSKVSEVSKTGEEAKVGGLAALLPPPKNSLGAGLAFGGGGGGSGGRRTAMETASVSKSTKELNYTRPNTSQKEGCNAGPQLMGNSSETQVTVNPTTQYHYSAQPGQGHRAPENGFSQSELRTPEGHFEQEQYTAAGACYTGGHQGHSSWQYADSCGVVSEPSSANSVPDPLGEVLQRERRKGKNEPPPQVIEVKQADLTAGRLREDQLRTTGIAFGPNYQPVSSGKDKPSKIHRRKHQIGALYFDMKSKEMEMLDRRSKGNLTKAETQAKYGW
ncbi:hypothetical protein Mapa_003896 [Marchantia paleacea]|nr:hypothetical protein Mapa_003896 [Marchantia paleacea]